MTVTRVLVVEDQSIIALDLKSRLMGLGYEVAAVVDNAEAAIRQAGALRPDLVLMDVRLKGELDGIQAAERIRARQDVPVIYLTAHSDEQTLRRARLTEPQAYLLKPFEDRELHIAIEIARHKHAMEQQVRAHDRWLTAILQGIGDAVIATDHAGQIKFINPAASAATGWEAAEAGGQALGQVLQLIDQTTGRPVVDPVAHLLPLEGAAEPSRPALLRDRQARTLPIEGRAAPTRADHGDVAGFVLIFRDVTERLRSEAALQASHAELARLLAQAEALAAAAQQASQIKDEILANTSHELRTPLTAIMGALDLVLDDLCASEAEQHSVLGVARRAADELLTMVTNLLDLAKLEAGQVQPQYVRVDLQSLLDETLLLMRGQAEQKGLALAYHWPADLAAACYTDPEHVRRIVLNLLNNAVKFTPAGGVTLSVQAPPDPSRLLQISVQDTGIGVAPEVQGRLFEPFFQADGSTTRRFGGTGLGLSISRRLAEILGGALTLVSAGEGRGTTVTLSMPAHRAPPGGA